MGRQQRVVRERRHPTLRQELIALPQMQHIDWGLSVVKADLLARQSADIAFDLAEIYMELSRRGQLAGYEVTTRFYEIGSTEGLRETEALLCKKP